MITTRRRPILYVIFFFTIIALVITRTEIHIHDKTSSNKNSTKKTIAVSLRATKISNNIRNLSFLTGPRNRKKTRFRTTLLSPTQTATSIKRQNKPTIATYNTIKYRKNNQPNESSILRSDSRPGKRRPFAGCRFRRRRRYRNTFDYSYITDCGSMTQPSNAPSKSYDYTYDEKSNVEIIGSFNRPATNEELKRFEKVFLDYYQDYYDSKNYNLQMIKVDILSQQYEDDANTTIPSTLNRHHYRFSMNRLAKNRNNFKVNSNARYRVPPAEGNKLPGTDSMNTFGRGRRRRRRHLQTSSPPVLSIIDRLKATRDPYLSSVDDIEAEVTNYVYVPITSSPTAPVRVPTIRSPTTAPTVGSPVTTSPTSRIATKTPTILSSPEPAGSPVTTSPTSRIATKTPTILSSPEPTPGDAPTTRDVQMRMILTEQSKYITFPDDNPTSPQNKALNWIISDENNHLSPTDDVDELTQRYVLAVFYYSTRGDDSWTNKNFWLTRVRECQWVGLSCTGDTKVNGLRMLGNKLAGTIPRELAVLNDLVALNLARNSISGTIPTPITDELTRLTSLDLQENKIIGRIPPSIGRLYSLQSLTLRNNEITGTIPTSIGNLTNVINLHLETNNIGGTLPTQMGNIVMLKSLSLNNNNFSGTIPVHISRLQRLEAASFQNNWLTGEMPPEICALNIRNLYADCRGDRPKLSCLCCTICY